MVAVADVSIYVVIELANVGDVKPHTGVRLYADFIYNLMIMLCSFSNMSTLQYIIFT